MPCSCENHDRGIQLTGTYVGKMHNSSSSNVEIKINNSIKDFNQREGKSLTGDDFEDTYV